MASSRNLASVVVDGVRLAYEDRGTGRPVVFVHGFAASSESWRQVAQTLSESYRTLTLDLMGSGHSDKPANQPYTLERQASLLRSFLEQLELRDFVLAGHSYGGGVSLSLLRLEHTLSLAGLALVDSICYPQPLPPGIRLLRTPLLGPLALRVYPAESVMRLVLKSAYYRPLAINPRLVKAYADALKSPGGRHALLQTARHLLPQDVDSLVRSYSQVPCPTFVLWGEKDAIVPLALGRRLASQIPGAAPQMVVLKDCGHVPQEEYPDRTAELLRAFLLRLPPYLG